MAAQIPSALKSVKPFLVIAKQYEKKDLVVSYYVTLYAVQEGIKLKLTDQAARGHLLSVMDQIEQMKQVLKAQDPDTLEDVVGSTHLEDAALKLFNFADGQDRAAQFGKNMIKAFFTSSQLFMALKQFGELSDEIEKKMKYAKWKAVEIDRCLKNGITPTPGPPGGGLDEEEDEFGEAGAAGGYPQPPPGNYGDQPGPSGFQPPPPESSSYGQPPPLGFSVTPPTDPPSPQPRHTLPPDIKPVPKPRHDHPPASYNQPPSGYSQYDPPSQPRRDEPPVHPPADFSQPPADYDQGISVGPGGAQLGPGDITKAQKYCKFASSALEYDDVEGALDYLSKAMKLLKTGKE